MIFFKKYGLFWQKIIQIPKNPIHPPPPFSLSSVFRLIIPNSASKNTKPLDLQLTISFTDKCCAVNTLLKFDYLFRQILVLESVWLFLYNLSKRSLDRFW